MRTVSAYAPGRVELLGNHTDYNEGYVLSAAIDKGIQVEMREASDCAAHLTSQEFPGEVIVPLSAIERQVENRWANYPLGVASEFLRAGFEVRGFAADIASNVPTGAGLSSSAALEVATAQALVKLFGFEVDPLGLAKLCKRAENEFVGVNSGLLDQVSSVFGKRGHAVFLDCRTEEIRRIPFPSWAGLLIINSGVKHQLVGGEYNERREQCFRAARELGVPFLRDTTMAELEAARPRIDPLAYRRALHVVGENESVQRALHLLEAGAVEQFGELMFASHESSRTNFENSTPELDLLVSLARQQPAILGSRLTGGGFGGATVSIVRREGAEQAAAEIAAGYDRLSGNRCAPFLCEIADGAH